MQFIVLQNTKQHMKLSNPYWPDRDATPKTTTGAPAAVEGSEAWADTKDAWGPAKRPKFPDTTLKPD